MDSLKKKYVLTSILALVLVGGFWFASSYWRNNTSQGSEGEFQVLENLQEFEIRNENMDEELKEGYYEIFQRERKALQAAIEEYDRLGSESRAYLYWPVMNLGMVHKNVGDYEKAESAFFFAMDLQPNAHLPYGQLGELYFRDMQEYDKAQEYYEKAIEIESDYIGQYYGELYEVVRYHTGDEGKAEKVLLSGVEKYPEHTEILALLALHYRQVGERQKAIERYVELLEKKPDSVVAQQGLEALR